MTKIRGSNPVWSFVDLTGKQFDDTFYMFVLTNDLPYTPETVWHDSDAQIPWTQPIQFFANGTLPIDIFWDPDVIYRLEFRNGPLQSDPLIYLVENYVPGIGTDTPGDVTINTDNQITNAQFSLINFNSPLVLLNVTPSAPIPVAPGWFLNVTGTGNITIERVAFNSTLPNPTNAPYALHIVLSGTFTGMPYLSQRFDQNGMLWSSFGTTNRFVSNSVTARVTGATQDFTASLFDSMGSPLTQVLAATGVNETFNEFTGNGLMPQTTNTNTPPNAFIEYRFFLPTTIDIYLTSFQLIVSSQALSPAYQQDTIQRQQDHTFHYYSGSLLRDSKDTILTGWDFGLNPWQSWPVASTDLPTFGYTADQTIMVQQAYVSSTTMNNITISRAAAALNKGFTVTAKTNTNQFAMIQYIPPVTIAPLWQRSASVMVKLNSTRKNPAVPLRVKMRLIYRTSLPPTLAQLEPISSWTALGEPAFAAGWTALQPVNDPTYNLSNSNNTLLFEGFQLPASSSDTMTLGLVIYTLDSMDSTATADSITFQKISFVPNDFAIDVNSLTFDETLRRCFAHYETSFDPFGAPTVAGPQRATFVSSVCAPMNPVFNSGTSQGSCNPNGFGLQFKSIKAIVPTLSIYSGSSTTVDRATAFVNTSSSNSQAEVMFSTFFTQFYSPSLNGIAYRATGLSAMVGPFASSSFPSANILYHYVANSRLGQ